MKLNKPKAQLMMYILAALFFVAGFFAVIWPVRTWSVQIDRDMKEYEELKKENEESSQAEVSPMPPVQEEERLLSAQETLETPHESSQMAVDWAACRKTNADIAAWLTIPGTPIDYPVVKTDDPDYYLGHTFSGKESAVGTLFSLGDADYETPGRNIAIYGHHMRAKDKMFTPLMQYKNPEFWEAHKTVYLDTPEHRRAYTIFAVINMSIGDWNPSKTDFPNDEAFANYIARAKRCALYDTGVQPTDHIVTLITCDRSYGGEDGRLIVMAAEQ